MMRGIYQLKKILVIFAVCIRNHSVIHCIFSVSVRIQAKNGYFCVRIRIPIEMLIYIFFVFIDSIEGFSCDWQGEVFGKILPSYSRIGQRREFQFLDGRFKTCACSKYGCFQIYLSTAIRKADMQLWQRLKKYMKIRHLRRHLT